MQISKIVKMDRVVIVLLCTLLNHLYNECALFAQQDPYAARNIAQSLGLLELFW